MSIRLTSSVRDMATNLLPRLKDNDRHHGHFWVPARHVARMTAAFVVICALSWLMTAGHARNAAAASQIMHNHANCNAEANRLYWRQRRQADELIGAFQAAPDRWRGARHVPTRALWIDPFRDYFNCPTSEKMGRFGDGGKWVCAVDTLLHRPGCVVYSFGSNGETSFEETILERTPCQVFTFDPTLNEAKLAKVMAVPRLNFSATGLATVDGEASFAGARRPVRTLRTIMKELGHDWIDVLKVDIETHEWRIFNDFSDDPRGIPATQLLTEFHFNMGAPMPCIDTMVGLQNNGMRVFHVEENNYGDNCTNGRLYEVAMINVDKNGCYRLSS